MAKIELIGVTKKFGKVTALDDISLEIRDKEFFVLFGPAGAGKTTILNIIAGIQLPNTGIIKINDEIANQIDPQHRNMAMVFENYALYPHLKVYDNMASPLRSPMYKKDEAYIKEAIEKVAALMKIDKLLERMPSQLSNGQRQRVALGRALVRSPHAYLMDEPLAHLDAKLRNLMRGELKEMQSNFNTTSIYVTHDFMEAMSLGDRIAIINEGKIVQIGTGDEVYYMPRNEFVAQLMGDPEINLLECKLSKAGGEYKVSMRDFGCTRTVPQDEELYRKLDVGGVENLHLGIRPQNFKYRFEPAEGFVQGSVNAFETIGNKSVLTVKLGSAEVRIIVPNGLPVKLDQDVYVRFEMKSTMFFNAQTTEYICRYNEAMYRDQAAEQVRED